MKSAEFPMMKELQSATREQMSFYNKMMKEKEMNERIKQLADQADAYTKSEYEKWVPTLDFYKIPNQRKIFNEKFAELIVEECGVALSPMLRDMVSRGQAFDLIKKHFGVEE